MAVPDSRWIRAPRSILAWTCVALLAGCEAMPEVGSPPVTAEPAPPPVVVEQDPILAELLAYYSAIGRKPAGQLRQEYKHLSGLLAAGVCDELRLRVAMLLTSPALAPLAGAKRTSKLLQPCLSPGEHEPVFTSLAEILQRRLAEQRRARAAIRRQLQLGERLEEAEARIGELNRKLDELKRIERSIRERQ